MELIILVIETMIMIGIWLGLDYIINIPTIKHFMNNEWNKEDENSILVSAIASLIMITIILVALPQGLVN